MGLSIDRKKVIGHLYDCLVASRLENMWVFVRKDIVGDALALLKEQEPVEPVISPETKYHKMYKSCGACGAFLANGARYCSFCGRMVKRND